MAYSMLKLPKGSRKLVIALNPCKPEDALKKLPKGSRKSSIFIIICGKTGELRYETPKRE